MLGIGDSVDVPVGVLVGSRVGLLVAVGVLDGGVVSCGSGVLMSTLSMVGNEAISDDCPPSVKVNSRLPRTITTEIPAAIAPSKMLLLP